MRHEVGELGGRLLGLGEAGHQVPLLVQAEHLVRGQRGHGLHTREVSPHLHIITLRGGMSVSILVYLHLPLQQVQVADHGVSPRVRVLRVLELPGQHLLSHVLDDGERLVRLLHRVQRAGRSSRGGGERA